VSDSISEERSRLVQTVLDAIKTRGRMVIVGASLAGLRGAEALRKAGFRGPLTIIGDEPDEPYDRPPLSKQATNYVRCRQMISSSKLIPRG
jgi:NAD(P)H-nitrite reductase large subunit